MIPSLHRNGYHGKIMALASIGLKTQLWNNNLKSLLLLAAYPFLIAAIVWGCAYVVAYSQGGFDMQRSDTPTGTLWLNTGNPEYVANTILLEFWPLILGVIGLWFIAAWFFHTNMVRSLSHSHPVTRLEEPELYNLLENLCISQGMTMPRLEIIETHARNAFASGVSEKTYSITVTRGLMNSLAKDELEGVLAHELSHIRHGDVRLLIVTIIFTGMIGFAAQMVWSSFRHGFVYSSRSNGKKSGGGALLLLGVLLVLWVGYFATLLMRFALSRRREYMADAGAVELTKNPEGLMRALMRISGKDQIPAAPADIGLMCIENHAPFLGLFATHPPIEARIKMLAAIGGASVPDTYSLPPVSAEERGVQHTPSTAPNPWLSAQRHRKS